MYYTPPTENIPLSLHDALPILLGNLRRVHVIDQQPTAAVAGGGWALVPNLAVVLNHRRIGLNRLTILEQEVFTPRVRSRDRKVERRVRSRCRAEAVGASAAERHDRHPAQLAERPRVHARWAEGR